MGSYAPPGRLTNKDLEKIVDTSDEWITTRTGIKERRIADEHTASSDLGIVAARRALANAGTDPSEIQLVITSTATPDMLFPATACIIQDKIGAVNAAAFDIEAGCSGFLYALSVGTSFVLSGMYDKVLVVGAETLTKIVNWKDRSTCVIFGDGAGAAVLTPSEDGPGIMGIHLGSDGSGAYLLNCAAGGSRNPASRETVDKGMHYLYMAGNEVFKFAVKIMEEASMRAIAKAGIKVSDVDCFIPHQANIRIIEAAAKRMGIPMDKVVHNVKYYGNTSCASIPLAMVEAIEQGRIRSGSIVVAVAFGAGLTWGSLVIKWK
jgi:3-oxoacyl-[acyl-carrier-protein] synthase-3